jgi:hypothetical protein
MFRRYLTRGLAAGGVAGTGYGLFVALAGNPAVGFTDAFGHHHEGGHAVSEAVTGVASVGGGVLWGLLLGAVAFGVVFYLVEPALPGSGAVRSLLLAGAGFLTVSGAPWLMFPPQPGGVVQSLPVGERLLWYGVMAGTAAIACGGAAVVYGRLRDAGRDRLVATVAALAPFALLAVPLAVGPTNTVTGEVPAAAVTTFRAVVVAGQVGLWALAAGVHASLHEEPTGEPALEADEPYPAD